MGFRLVRSLVACVAITLSALGAGACGSSGDPRHTASGGQATTASRDTVGGALVKDTDGDDDRPGSRFDPDTDIALTFGHPADVRDTQAVAVLIGGYYKAAAAGDGRKACSMMFWLYAETTVEEHSKGKGARSLRGSTCAQIAGKVFRGRHRELVEDAGSVNVSVLRVQGKQGLARVRFGATRERLIPLKLDRGAWRMNTLLDAGAP